MAGWTNKGKMRMLQWGIQGVSYPANYFLALCTDATAPTQDTNTLADLTQIAVGNGYADGGMSVARDATDWPDLAEDDTGDKATLKAKDLVFTATGGPLPASGSGARYAVLLGPNATPSAREVLFYWDLVSARSVSQDQTLTLQDSEIDIIQ
jgi:hypothetical protein